ncbi:MAG TPA: hypothetical protein VNF47_11675 [Streptosporangiaceae bacterium]|nr:hypothetical protein [Streptosporangiaceae bacterium]
MRRNRVLAATVAGVISAASFTTTALAAQSQPTGTGQFRTWHAAQAAARFRLMRPTQTYGLARNGRILVIKCAMTKRLATKRLVLVSYGPTPFRTLMLSQNNSGGPCTSIGNTKKLGHVRVHGVLATLRGLCGRTGLRSCSSRNIVLFLIWRRHGVYYVASSFGEFPRRLIGFARSLVPVR